MPSMGGVQTGSGAHLVVVPVELDHLHGVHAEVVQGALDALHNALQWAPVRGCTAATVSCRFGFKRVCGRGGAAVLGALAVARRRRGRSGLPKSRSSG